LHIRSNGNRIVDERDGEEEVCRPVVSGMSIEARDSDEGEEGSRLAVTGMKSDVRDGLENQKNDERNLKE
jgi:hypothetical protein